MFHGRIIANISRPKWAKGSISCLWEIAGWCQKLLLSIWHSVITFHTDHQISMSSTNMHRMHVDSRSKVLPSSGTVTANRGPSSDPIQLWSSHVLVQIMSKFRVTPTRLQEGMGYRGVDGWMLTLCSCDHAAHGAPDWTCFQGHTHGI